MFFWKTGVPTRLHGITYQKIVLLIAFAVSISNLTQHVVGIKDKNMQPCQQYDTIFRITAKGFHFIYENAGKDSLITHFL
jgi:hypothetical protein